MRFRLVAVFHGLSLALLWCASLLVPRRQRDEWWREWQSELWHVRRARTPEQGISWAAEREVAAFCLGAFQDARCFRGPTRSGRVPLATTKGSAKQCISLMASLAAASSVVSLLLPAARIELQPSPYRDARNLVLMRDARYTAESVPPIPAEQFQIWTRRRQQVFDGFAFYRPGQETVSRSSTERGSVEVAHASSNLFELLGIPIRFAGSNAHGLPQLVLSDAMWEKEFGRDAHVSGRMIQVGLRQAVIAGVASKNSWRLPGKEVDAWLLLPDAEIASEGSGFVVAHVNHATGQGARGDRWNLFMPAQKGEEGYFLCTSLAWRARVPWNIFLFAVFLACLSLPATTSLPLGEYRVTSRTLSWSTRLRRWGFLGVKISLLLVIVFFVPFDLAHLGLSFVSLPPENIQVISSFLICLFGLRWIIRDQRQRCPMCLGMLTHPARVGQPSRNFLAWNGTELICAGGHGLLHIPEISTSWFGVQRWLYLDPSWEGLFAEPGLASSGYF